MEEVCPVNMHHASADNAPFSPSTLLSLRKQGASPLISAEGKSAPSNVTVSTALSVGTIALFWLALVNLLIRIGCQ